MGFDLCAKRARTRGDDLLRAPELESMGFLRLRDGCGSECMETLVTCSRSGCVSRNEPEHALVSRSASGRL